MAWLTATYLIASAPERIEERAEALAIEQSVECPPEAVHDARIRDEIVARVASIDLLLSLCLMPAGQVLAGPISDAIGVDATLILAGTLMCVPNFLVLVLVPEVRSVRRRDAEPEAKPAPALSAF